ncbi:Putative D-isomer specific 2-hydroxyacid dehydrogenase, catalytic domain-containing protein [Colletotrichum destructivum]|uniref:D-isomer specific 2-hydroxyacid dehydrogenase, catalytic domain-containing protein n=1 Tax=Colletotrichum destructivum TaxID=34406 RepID=A0AAX4IE04_9PEZI|nr:Putative D-isomer specific 2-hydroxyacid dehydrogenase, catalytic domain-containing protein [Colletotrichum destructivum]
MAPSRIDSPVEAVGELSVALQKKPTMYLLEKFPEEAVKYCQAHFHTILPLDEEVANWRENADAILVREKIITAQDISSARRLRAIGKQGTGIDIIDKDAADARGIAICNTPGVNAQSVAELVLALTMAVARQLRTISVKQAAGNEVRKEHCMGMTLTGKSVGILGMGAIGTAVATMFRGAFGARVWAYDPFAPAKAWSDIEHTRVQNFEEMLPHVDVLTLHIPLNSQTQGLIGAKQLTAMKAGSILINVARGGIVDEPALIRVLNEGHLFGAGLDCHEEEPPTLQKHQALWETGRVISTPHIGATTKETVVKTATSAIDNVLRHLSSTSTVS